ncbi:MAG: hypothetical protein VKJ24_22240 [Synechococcales bacterium]|nr:hypothetical protein [Synechococcales bacterium]
MQKTSMTQTLLLTIAATLAVVYHANSSLTWSGVIVPQVESIIQEKNKTEAVDEEIGRSVDAASSAQYVALVLIR